MLVYSLRTDTSPDVPEATRALNLDLQGELMMTTNRFAATRRAVDSVAVGLLLGAAFTTSCSDERVSAVRFDPTATALSPSRTPADDGVTVHWNEVARAMVAAHNTNGPMASRVYALVSVAQFIAARGSAESRERERAATLPRAIARASSEVLSALYPDSAASIGIPAPGGDATRGDSIGSAAGRVVLAYAAMDGSAGANCPATPPLPANRFWHDDAVPPNPQALLPCFGKVNTWLHLDVTRFRAEPPPEFGSPKFLRDLAEVRQISDTRTAEVLAVVDRWLDGNNSFTPAGHWNLIASDLITRHHLGDAEAARALAMLNVAMMDTHVACWDRKFAYWEIRPWQVDPLITTPRGRPHHPGNPSGHACAGGAGAGTLAGLFPLEGDSLLALGREQGFTTVQSGVHLRLDVDTGFRIGRAIAAKTLELRDPRDLAAALPHL